MINYVGKLKFYNEEVFYSFDGMILKLYPSNELAESIIYQDLGNGAKALTSERKPLESDILYGVILENNNRIVFCIHKDNYGFRNVFVAPIITIPVYEYFLFSSDRSDDKYTITYCSKEFARFTGILPKVTNSKEDDLVSSHIEFQRTTEKLISVFEIDNVKTTICPYWSINNSKGAELTLGLKLILDSKEVELNVFKKHIFTLIHLVNFLFYRNDICPNEIKFTSPDGSGTFYSNCHKEYVQEIENTNAIWRDSIPWAKCYDIIPQLYKKIFIKELYLAHIPDTLDERLVISIYDIQKISSAFENIYNKLYLETPIKKSDKRIKAEINAKENVEKLISNSTGKEKDIYKCWLKHIGDITLEDKIKFCLYKFENQLSWIKTKFAPDLTFDFIASICAKNRNEIDHGDKEILEDKVANAFGMLRVLVICMQLKECGMLDDNIEISIRNLFSLKRLGV